MTHNPAANIVGQDGEKAPADSHKPRVELLLEQPDCVDMKNYRDKATRVLYATGIRVSRLIALNKDDVNLDGPSPAAEAARSMFHLPGHNPRGDSYINLVHQPEILPMPTEPALFVRHERGAAVPTGVLENHQSTIFVGILSAPPRAKKQAAKAACFVLYPAYSWRMSLMSPL